MIYEESTLVAGIGILCILWVAVFLLKESDR